MIGTYQKKWFVIIMGIRWSMQCLGIINMNHDAWMCPYPFPPYLTWLVPAIDVRTNSELDFANTTDWVPIIPEIAAYAQGNNLWPANTLPWTPSRKIYHIKKHMTYWRHHMMYGLSHASHTHQVQNSTSKNKHILWHDSITRFLYSL